MKKGITLICMACLCINMSVFAQDDTLQEGFINPPASAKARTWWHWLNGNVTRAGITADLEAMKQVGIQEAQIFNADMGYPEGPATFLSSEWLELFKFAASEAERLGLELGFHNGAGWSSSGGPWITPEYAMQTVVCSDTLCRGGEKIKIRLSQPATRLNYYKDIAVLAFPNPQSGERIDDLDIKSLSGRLRNHLEPDMKSIPQSALVHRTDIIDLTSKTSVDGSLEWDAPNGEWVILRVGHTPTGAENRPAVIGGRGLECDKMNKKAVDVYWEGGIKPIIGKLGNLVGTALTNCLIDSYEVGCTNWTTNFDKEFKRLRKYDCMPFLPVLAGYYVDGGEITERFLWDFRRTIGDLITENYYNYFRKLCHEHGMKLSVEPYWGPFNSMEVGDTGDIVMCEFWSGSLAFFDSPKFVASIAHLNGSPIVGAEAFTGNGGWLGHPATIKQIGDKAWAAGVNRFIFHTYAHQPWDVGPGVTFGSYGFELNRLNTWWKQGKDYMMYIGRSQFLLQQGQNVADVLVFTGESSPNDAILMPEITSLGYDYDLIGISKMMSLTVKDGLIYTPAGGKYRVIVLPESSWMTPEMLMKIEELAKSGALIIGPKPQKSPSLQNYPVCDKQVSQLAEKLWDKNLVKDCSVVDILKGENFSPDFSTETGIAGDINFIHRQDDKTDIYFVTSSQQESHQAICRFRVTGKQPELWNPETGKIEDVAVWKENGDGTISIPIQFDPDGAVFMIFRKPVTTTRHIVKAVIDIKKEKTNSLSDLKIIKAEYGTFLPEGVVDVTESVVKSVRDSKLNIHSGSHLSPVDPAPGYIKELRIEYEIKGKRQEIHAIEGEAINIDAGNSSEFKILRAVYGKFGKGIHGIPSSYSTYDVTNQLKSKVLSGVLQISVNDGLVTDMSNLGPKKELHVVYATDGEICKRSVPEGETLNLAQSTPESKLISDKSKITWVTPYLGKMTYTTSLGETRTVQVDSIPKSIELTGPWNVTFPYNSGMWDTTFDKLISWSNSSDERISYFSGTATYKKQFTLSEELLQSDYSLELDLGCVRVIAEVIVNGKKLGILWKTPFRVNLHDAVHKGVNDLEIKITNLWPNKLIGDERFPDDIEWNGSCIKKWPEWLTDHKKRSSERTTFSTWKFWNKDSPLQSSGLLGPVVIRPYIHVNVEY